MTQQEFNQMLAVAIAGGLGGGTYISQWNGEEIDTCISKLLLPGGILTQNLADSSVTTPKLAPEARKSNPNLLDNAYFIGGGSQQGGGQFPINQRGLTEYTGAGYTIDRWFISNSSCKLNIEETGLRITRLNNGHAFFMQRIPFAMLQDGIYTFSAIVDDELQSMTLQVNQTMSRVLSSFAGGWALGFEVSGENYVPHIRSLGTNSAESVFVAATKLELGNHQTLAYESGGGYKLIDPAPNYTDELMRCQRYQRVIPIGHILNGYLTSGATTFEFKCPDGMRDTNPTFLFDGAKVVVRTVDGYSSVASLNSMGTITNMAAIKPNRFYLEVADKAVIGPNNAPASLTLYEANILIDKNL